MKSKPTGDAVEVLVEDVQRDLERLRRKAKRRKWMSRKKRRGWA